jgi:hypothetical protein
MIDDRAEALRTLILGEISRRCAGITAGHLHVKPQNQHVSAKARVHELNSMAAFVLSVRLPAHKPLDTAPPKPDGRTDAPNQDTIGLT